MFLYSLRIVDFFGFMQKPSLLIRDPGMIKKVTIKDFNHFTNHDNYHDLKIDKFFDKMVLILRDEKWKEVRSTLNPIFTSAKLKFMFGLLSESVDNFIKVYEKKAREN